MSGWVLFLLFAKPIVYFLGERADGSVGDAC